LFRKALAVLVVREHLSELVLEDRHAARLETHDRRSGTDLFPEAVERAPQMAPRKRQGPVVVERPPAADMAVREDDVVADVFESLEPRVEVPHPGDVIPLVHLEEQARPDARPVLLLAHEYVARAHDPSLCPPAFTDHDTAHGGVCEGALAFPEPEVRLHLGR